MDQELRRYRLVRCLLQEPRVYGCNTASRTSKIEGIGFGCVGRLGVESKSVNFIEMVKEFRELAIELDLFICCFFSHSILLLLPVYLNSR